MSDLGAEARNLDQIKVRDRIIDAIERWAGDEGETVLHLYDPNEVKLIARAIRDALMPPPTATLRDPDALDGFTVHAGWATDGSADLSMCHDACGWWLEDEAIPGAVAPAVHDYPFEGSAPLRTLAERALLHACEKRQGD